MVFDALVAGFTKTDIRALAGEKSFERGIEYIRAVTDLELDGDVLYAVVHGTERYEVELNVGPQGLSGTCDCPWGQEGNFCKHCVAVALVYEYDRDNVHTLPNGFGLRAQLESLDHGQLVGLVMKLAGSDRGLRRRLRARLGQPAAGE
jgi:uncharacterized Zn finger protein